jgi:DNA-binding NtrC family response regulator
VAEYAAPFEDCEDDADNDGDGLVDCDDPDCLLQCIEPPPVSLYAVYMGEDCDNERVMRTLLAHDWPGNVRQLENALEYATTVCEGETLHERDLPREIVMGEPPAAKRAPLEPLPLSSAAQPDLTRGQRYPAAADIEAALAQSRYRKGEAASLLGVSRTTLWRRMRALGLD